MRTILKILFLGLLFCQPACAQDFPLKLEITSYETSVRGYQGSGETTTSSGSGISMSSGRTVVPVRAVTNTGVLDTAQGRLRCVLWNRKHYLLVGSYQARQVSGDKLEVQVNGKKGKHEEIKFKIIAASKVD
jgi:hypothetical protein